MSQIPSMSYGSHVLGTDIIRVQNGEECFDKNVSKDLIPEIWTLENMKSHIQTLLKLLLKKLDFLVLVNPGHFNFKFCQAAINGVPSEETKVKIISALMARFLFVTQDFPDPPPENHSLIILTKIMDFTDFHILTRKDSVYILMEEILEYSSNIETIFSATLEKYPNSQPIIIYDSHNENFKNEIIASFCNKKENQTTIQKIHEIYCEKWNEMLLNGGYYKASTFVDKEIKKAIDVKNFTLGFQITSTSIKKNLIEVGMPAPYHRVKKIKIENEKSLICSNSTLCFKDGKFKRVTTPEKQLTLGFYEIVIKIDDDGFGYIKVTDIDDKKVNRKSSSVAAAAVAASEIDLTIKESDNAKPKTPTTNVVEKLLPKNTNHFEIPNGKRFSNFKKQQQQIFLPRPSPPDLPEPNNSFSRDKENQTFNQTFNQTNTTPLTTTPEPNNNNNNNSLPSFTPKMPTKIFEQRKNSVTTKTKFVAATADFIISLNDNWISFSLPQNDGGKGGTFKRIKNINGNEWMPMYLSFAREIPRIGEVAKLDLKSHSDCVIYDLHKIIGVPISEIKTNLKNFPFKIASTDDPLKPIVIEVNTYKGEHQIDPIIALSLFFIGIRKEVERVAKKSLKRVLIKKTNPFGKSVFDAIKQATKYANLEVIGIEPMQNIYVEEEA